MENVIITNSWNDEIAVPVAFGFHCTLINALNSVPQRTIRASQSPHVERVCRTKCANPLPFVGAPTTSALWHQLSHPRQPLIVITHQTAALLSQFLRFIYEFGNSFLVSTRYFGVNVMCEVFSGSKLFSYGFKNDSIFYFILHTFNSFKTV